MSVWILTTGNSDVRLKHERNWNRLFTAISSNLECEEFASATPINPKDKREGYTVPARVLGLTYTDQPNHFDDLEFPLIDTFFTKIEKDNIELEEIIILLTDQSNLFCEEQRLNEKCAYWQDTISLKPLLIKYFANKFENKFENKYNVPIKFITLTPQSTEGLDYWDATLDLVKAEFSKLQISQVKAVYISHQAGTPAISSAVQFVSLGKFKNVKFLVSNQYYDSDYNQQSEAKIIDSSQYWRGIQIQKAKQLIVTGFPGTALKMLDGITQISQTTLDELRKMVDFFNLHSVERDNTKDFEIANASQRIIDSLDLIRFFFNQNNYLQGISLLAAAQETFLKVAILNETAKIQNKYRGVAVSEFLQWDNEGLSLINMSKSQNITWSKIDELNTIKEDIFKLLKFPVDKDYFKRYDRGEVIFKTNANNVMLEWLKKLNPELQTWANLKWSCDYYKDRESDLRNQLMHNLRGMEDSDVIDYLLGYSKVKPNNIATVIDTYSQNVKKPFLEAIALLKLPYKPGKLQKKLNAIADNLV
ncbi:hypothetical protein [Brunnivagina elsteri]|uniref:CRISPR-associated protein n=1 Tax=Brunnivagina elsteri CCALA 953 TaxID=987040 RepID=A0A2A2TEF1_9CYAN|nr:hypothetical protein [Calothrix elsteri]PAX52130.1 hypothetical protein CK510_20975 [Calothrix elsteri CCALA 953]